MAIGLLSSETSDNLEVEVVHRKHDGLSVPEIVEYLEANEIGTDELEEMGFTTEQIREELTDYVEGTIAIFFRP